MKETCSIILSDGTILDNIEYDDFYFAASYKIDRNVFSGNCSPFTVCIGGEDIIHQHAELAVFRDTDDGVAFRFRDLTAKDVAQRKMEANLEYLAMMLDIDLEE